MAVLLMIYPSGTYTVTSSNLAVVRTEKVLDQYWKVTAVAPGTAEIMAVSSDGKSGNVMVTVVNGSQDREESTDLSANMEIRQEMIRLINQTRREHGVRELTVNTALMNAAQDCSTQEFREHHTEYECKATMAYGYPHGFGDNLTYFSGYEYLENVALTAVNNWINSPDHFQTMVAERYDTIGVGVTINNGQAYCYMFAGNPNSHHPYE